LIPPEAIEFLCAVGVPELIQFRGIDHVFTLDLQPLLGKSTFRLGTVDHAAYSMAIERDLGHFGYVFEYSEQRPWCFCNSSVMSFLECFAVSERLWQMEEGNQIHRDDRAGFLETRIREIDPAALSDENNIWSFLIEEVQNGIV
jgi:hypothetical protein